MSEFKILVTLRNGKQFIKIITAVTAAEAAYAAWVAVDAVYSPWVQWDTSSLGTVLSVAIAE